MILKILPINSKNTSVKILEKKIRYLKQIVFYLLFLLSLTCHIKAYAFEILSDSETETTIRKLISPILQAANINPKNLNLYIILDNEVNAFVIGSNNLFINTGLITTFNNPDVLKGVVAHEIGHITGNHSTTRYSQIQDLMSQSILINLLGAAAIIGGAGDLGAAVLTGGSHTLQGNYLRYSRFQETAADNSAIRYLHASHNTIKGLIQLFEYFEKEFLRIGDNINPYMLTHPMSNERLQFTRKFLKNENSTYRSSIQEHTEYAQIVAKLRGFTIPLENFSDKRLQDLSPSAQLYAKSIILYRSALFNQAIDTLNQLIKQSPNNGFLYELKGQFLFESGNTSKSINSYKQAISLLPDKPLILSAYAIVLINASNSASNNEKEILLKEAIKILNKVISLKLNNHPYVYRQLAIAYGKLGQLDYSNLMLAEESLLLHKFQEAKKFIKLAEKYKGNNKYLSLRIDDILKTLPN